MGEETRVDEIVQLELDRLGTDDERDYFQEFLERIDRFETRIDTVIGQLRDEDDPPSLLGAGFEGLDHLDSCVRVKRRLAAPVGGVPAVAAAIPFAVADSFIDEGMRRLNFEDSKPNYKSLDTEPLDEHIAYSAKDYDNLETEVIRLNDETLELQKTIQQLEDYISFLGGKYELNTSLAKKVGEVVLKKRGRIVTDVAAVAGSSLVVALGEVSSLAAIFTATVDLGKTAYGIYKEVKKWKVERRVPKQERNNAINELAKLKGRLVDIKNQLKDWHASSDANNT